MADETGIAWTRSTSNPWIGCTKVGPGCDACYAEVMDKHRRWGGATHWGAGVPRYRTSEALRKRPLQWDRLCAWEKEHGELAAQWKGKWHTPGFWPVFCSSLADVFDNEVPDGWRADLWQLIEQTPNLSWLLVTKRISNVLRMAARQWTTYGFPPNVRIMITVVNQEEADRDIPKLLALRCKNGISYEPALGRIDFCEILGMWWNTTMQCFEATDSSFNPRGLGWVIVGGESSQGSHRARPFNIEWARSTVRQCNAAGVPVFVKQLGSAVMVRNDSMEEWPDEDAFCDAIPDNYEPQYQGEGVCIRLRDRAGADPAEWPEDLRVREFPA